VPHRWLPVTGSHSLVPLFERCATLLPHTHRFTFSSYTFLKGREKRRCRLGSCARVYTHRALPRTTHSTRVCATRFALPRRARAKLHALLLVGVPHTLPHAAALAFGPFSSVLTLQRGLPHHSSPHAFSYPLHTTPLRASYIAMPVTRLFELRAFAFYLPTHFRLERFVRLQHCFKLPPHAVHGWTVGDFDYYSDFTFGNTPVRWRVWVAVLVFLPTLLHSDCIPGLLLLLFILFIVVDVPIPKTLFLAHWYAARFVALLLHAMRASH